MKDGTHNLHLPNKEADMANTTPSTKKAGAKKAPAKTAPAKKAAGKAGNGKMSKTELLRVYFVRPYPKFPTVADAKIAMPTVSESRIKVVSTSVHRTLRTAERLGKLKK